MLRFRQMKSLQKFASVHASFHNQVENSSHWTDATYWFLIPPSFSGRAMTSFVSDTSSPIVRI
jgi:hypothetical protein